MRKVADQYSDIQAVSKNLISYIRIAFAIFKEDSSIPCSILDALEGVFIRSATFRHDVLRGGAHLEDLLSKRENLLRCLGMVPGLIVNSEMISLPHKPRMGIGVALMGLALLQDLTDAIIEGDQRCRHHHHNRRTCVASEIPLCLRLSSARHLSREDLLHCSREEAMRTLFQATAISSIAWL
jgi:hypothetical protein